MLVHADLLGVANKIMEWGDKKGINNPMNQFRKMCEETLEAQEAYIESKKINFLDLDKADHLYEEIGDMGVVWLLLCQAAGIDPTEALEAAHNKNKNRKGVTINGDFRKIK